MEMKMKNWALVLPPTPPRKGEYKKSQIFCPEQHILSRASRNIKLTENWVGHDSPFGGGQRGRILNRLIFNLIKKPITTNKIKPKAQEPLNHKALLTTKQFNQ
jgi:hypothetical protein